MKEEEIRSRSALNRYLELLGEDTARLFADRSLFVRVPCPACGSSSCETQFEKTGFTYVLCRQCNTLYVNPRPPADQLVRMYTDSPSVTYWVNDFFKPMAEARREKIFRPRAEYITSTFPGLSGGVIGDIGAGFGLFLQELARFWPSARLIAIEPSTEMAAICRSKKIEVVPSAVENVEGWDGKFDLLTSFELFEHLYNPAEFLNKANRLLRNGGYLLLTTLNGEGFDIQVLWENSKAVMPPHHLNFFNPRSVRTLLEANGYKVEAIDTPGRLDWDIVEGMYRQDGVDPGRFWRLLAERGASDVKGSLQTWISASRLSSHMRVLARKWSG